MNQILDARAIDAEDDASAVESARQLVEKKVVEVWQGDRQVARLTPEHERQIFE